MARSIKLIAILVATVVTLLGCAQVEADVQLQSLSWDGLYNLMFRYSSKRLSDLESQVVLLKMNLLKTNLPADDARRADVAFWIDASINKESKCDRRDDEIMKLRLQQDKLKAKEQGMPRRLKDQNLNLETYVNSIRAERMSYCENLYDKPFMIELTKWKMDNYKDIYALTSDFQHEAEMDEKVLGDKVGAMISQRLDQMSYDELSQSLDKVDLIKKHYDKHSPCVGLLGVVQKYAGYYSLLTAPGNYQNLRPLVRNWVDKVSVCLFIENSKPVHENAAEYILNELTHED